MSGAVIIFNSYWCEVVWRFFWLVFPEFSLIITKRGYFSRSSAISVIHRCATPFTTSFVFSPYNHQNPVYKDCCIIISFYWRFWWADKVDVHFPELPCSSSSTPGIILTGALSIHTFRALLVSVKLVVQYSINFPTPLHVGWLPEYSGR